MSIRERERQPGRDRRRHDYDWNEARAVQRQRIRELFDDRPRVVRYDDVPWEQVHQAYHKIFTGDNLPDIERKLRRAPIYTMSARLQVLESGTRSGNHRHYPEALFYVLEGSGHEVHDDRRWDWGPGDLVVVPRYCVHQHFCDEGPATLYYVIGGFAMEMGLMPIEQFELHSDFVPPDGAEILHDADGRMVGYLRADGKKILLRGIGDRAEAVTPGTVGDPVTGVASNAAATASRTDDGYEYFTDLAHRERAERAAVAHVVEGSGRALEDTRNGRIKWLMHPQRDPGIRTYEFYVQEIPPGGSSGRHRHVGEELHFIVEGNGYEVIDGERHDWAANDVVAVPILSEHQSFNPSTIDPVTMLVTRSNDYHHYGFGGIEHLEDARS
ncbi:MAG: cupin domain-containing protein [Acidimicrobiales bacterium]